MQGFIYTIAMGGVEVRYAKQLRFRCHVCVIVTVTVFFETLDCSSLPHMLDKATIYASDKTSASCCARVASAVILRLWVENT